mmetsp:Transcript_7680/g.8143  ORF Transcript_7680/g.8143 Transcript_7680/m.8143 type:complete len:452 (+) Transcript_7680:1063-2418(+)
MVDIQITIQHLPDLQPIPWPSNWKVGKTEERLRREYHFTDGVIKLNDRPLDPDETFAEQMANVEGEKNFTFVNGISTLPTSPVVTTSDLGSKLDHLIGVITREKSLKSASRLTETDLKYFSPVIILEASDVIANLNLNPDPKYQSVEAKVSALALELITLYSKSGIGADEVREIQPKTFRFFNETCRIYFSEIWNDEKMCLANDSFSTSYNITIFNDFSTLRVEGKTDSTLYYKGVTVGSWEDKNFSINLTEPNVVAQALSELTAISSNIYDAISRQSFEYTGILTNGLKWSLMIKEFLSGAGKFIYKRTKPITLTDGITPPTPEDLRNVTLLILYHLQTIYNNIQMIDNSLKGNHKRRHDEINTVQEEKDDDEDDENNDNVQPSRKKLSIISGGSLSTTSNQSTKTTTRGRGGGRGGSKTKKSAYQNENSKSMLTFENVYRFNLSHPIFL